MLLSHPVELADGSLHCAEWWTVGSELSLWLAWVDGYADRDCVWLCAGGTVALV